MTRDFLGGHPRPGEKVPRFAPKKVTIHQTTVSTPERNAGGLALDLIRLLVCGALFVGTAGMVLALGLPRPFLWIWLAALPLCLFGGVRAKTEFGRKFFLVCLGLALSFGLLEGGFAIFNWLKPGAVEVKETTSGVRYYIMGGPLGYGPRPGVRVVSRKTFGNQAIYDVDYTISDRRVRVTRGNPNGDTWLFMGCSIMFGEGVNDDETLPAYFSADLGYQANVVNLGFHGYGPHQMLRSLELDLPRPLIHGAVRQVVYEGIWSHARRAAGKVIWDPYGPSYALSRDGVTYVGPFNNHLTGFMIEVLDKSQLFRFVLDRTLYSVSVTDEDIERYARILERSSQLSLKKYGAGFLVVFRDGNEEPSRRIMQRLRKTNLQILPLSEVIPRSDWTGLTFPNDGHPKPEYNRRLAAALAARLSAVARRP